MAPVFIENWGHLINRLRCDIMHFTTHMEHAMDKYVTFISKHEYKSAIAKDWLEDHDMEMLQNMLYLSRNFHWNELKENAKSRKMDPEVFTSFDRTNRAIMELVAGDIEIYLEDLSAADLSDLRSFAFRKVELILHNYDMKDSDKEFDERIIFTPFAIDRLDRCYELIRMIDGQNYNLGRI